MFPVPEEADLTDPAFLPLLVARPLVEESLSEQKELGSDAVDELLVLLAGPDLDLFQLDLWMGGDRQGVGAPRPRGTKQGNKQAKDTTCNVREDRQQRAYAHVHINTKQKQNRTTPTTTATPLLLRSLPGHPQSGEKKSRLQTIKIACDLGKSQHNTLTTGANWAVLSSSLTASSASSPSFTSSGGEISSGAFVSSSAMVEGFSCYYFDDDDDDDVVTMYALREM